MRIVHRFLTGCVVAMVMMSVIGLAAEPQWGTLRGQILYDGKIDAGQQDDTFTVDPDSKGIANVLVCLAFQPIAIHPDLDWKKKLAEKEKNNDLKAERPDEVKFEIKDHKFVPRVLVVQTGQKIRITSHDAVVHNVHSMPLRNTAMNMILSPNVKEGILTRPFEKTEKAPFRVVNDLRPTMKASWFVLDHPYATATNDEGKFEIAKLPVGDHAFMIWHERFGWLDKNHQVQIKPGLNEVQTIEFGPP